jgi:uncharacterized protein
MSSIITRSGRRFDFINPEPESIDIEDIAHALSQIGRFTGHTRFFYSVAQHSLLVSCLVPPEHALDGLLHDAHEAYVGDVASPLKRLLPEYMALETRIATAVRARYGLPMQQANAVTLADVTALYTEMRDLMGGVPKVSAAAAIELVPTELLYSPPTLVRDMFLRRFRELTR